MTTDIPRVIFIVPYRDREQQYRFFDGQMKNVVMKDCGYNYRIVYVQQCDARSFNRGAMKNIGFLWVRQQYPNDYRDITLVFNDVDNMPYTAGFLNYPTSVGIVKHFYGFRFALGGIVSITGVDFERVGGFPNFWAWGYEDNTLQQRCLWAHLTIDRSQFYPIYDKNILHFLDGVTRPVNRTEFDRFKGRNNTEGWSAIRDLQIHWNENSGFLDVYQFATDYVEDASVTRTHDLREGQYPFGRQIGRRGGGAKSLMMNFSMKK